MNKLDSENMALVCAAFLKSYCEGFISCKGCPFSTVGGGCALTNNNVPEAWEVESHEE